jgi:hypothetical protein
LGVHLRNETPQKVIGIVRSSQVAAQYLPFSRSPTAFHHGSTNQATFCEESDLAQTKQTDSSLLPPTLRFHCSESDDPVSRLPAPTDEKNLDFCSSSDTIHHSLILVPVKGSP